jgi:hypothetical protein
MKDRSSLPLAVIAAVFLLSTSLTAQKLKPEEIIAKHLDSIAPADKRAATKSLVAVGEVQVDYITQKNQSAKGRVVVASEGQKLFFGLSLNAADYSQEKIIFDGKKSSVDFVRPGVRSDLGSFVQSNDELASHGLLGGTLSTSWALLNAEQGKAKISSSGTKKIDGIETYALAYAPKGGNDLEITMYFDKQTFRHVRTEYSRIISSGIGRTINESARTSETRLKVTEDFSDYKDFQGRMIPHKYKMYYTFTGTNGTKEVSWTYVLTEFAFNQALDAGTFAVK